MFMHTGNQLQVEDSAAAFCYLSEDDAVAAVIQYEENYCYRFAWRSEKHASTVIQKNTPRVTLCRTAFSQELVYAKERALFVR
jgi:hypothetical protein